MNLFRRYFTQSTSPYSYFFRQLNYRIMPSLVRPEAPVRTGQCAVALSTACRGGTTMLRIKAMRLSKLM